MIHERDARSAPVRQAVFAEIEMVAREHTRTIAPLADNLRIEHSGLDSLCMAILITRLDERFEACSFDDGADFDLPVTVGDLVKAYANDREMDLRADPR